MTESVICDRCGKKVMRDVFYYKTGLYHLNCAKKEGYTI